MEKEKEVIEEREVKVKVKIFSNFADIEDFYEMIKDFNKANEGLVEVEVIE